MMDRLKLKKALMVLKKGKPTGKSSPDVLQQINVKGKDNILEFYQTDLTVGIKLQLVDQLIGFDPDIDSCNVGIQELYKLIMKATSLDDININQTDDDKLNIADRFDLETTKGENYPTEFDCEITESVTPDVGLLDRLETLLHYKASDTSREFLTGVFFNDNGDVVATDAHRLAKLNNPSLSSLENSYLVPSEVVETFVYLDSKLGVRSWTINFGKKGVKIQATTDFGFWEITGRLIAEDFPKYQDVIPEDTQYNGVVNIDRKELQNELKMVVTMVDKSKKLIITPGDSDLNVKTDQMGSNYDYDLSATIQGNPAKIGLNADYLLQLVKDMEDDQVGMRTINPDSPAGFFDRVTEIEYIIMPLRLDN